MMQEFRIEYRKGTFLEFEIDDYVIITGNTYQLKREVNYALERLFYGKTLSDMEMNYFGTNGILTIDGKNISDKEACYLSITQFSSLEKVYSIKKGSLLYDRLIRLSQEKIITQQLERVNDELLRLEDQINLLAGMYLKNITININQFEFEELIKSYSSYIYRYDGQEVPLDTFTLNLAYQDMLELIKFRVEEEGRLVILLLDLEPFRTINFEVAEFITQLIEIANNTHLIKLIIFDDGDLNQKIPLSISKTIIVTDDIQQMPEDEIFYQSIKRNYPDKITCSDSNLRDRFYCICKYLGHQIYKNISLSSKDVVLLYVVKDLLADNTYIETSVDSLSEAEKFYLASKNTRY
ncbi:CRISPR-associated protein Csn2-St [Facklamia hominis]|uniref:Uncharacterized protein n=1 Tax=Facklamia hominis CCUG 36813 TaxID=883111 RepID=K1MEE5_9LACT|nr:CRISPR-associated protein Csn2-St [Facklamia hominis]EKB54424.1 hypothetical protein HMPREF9706_00614 [Facklamia hominis CCUG 36813]